jgi:DNA-binding PadR family transcriptional regulator
MGCNTGGVTIATLTHGTITPIFDRYVLGEDGYIPSYKKQQDKAKQRITEKFCPNCKKRLAKLVGVVNCMELTKKINRQRFKKVRCANFKRTDYGCGNITT